MKVTLLVEFEIPPRPHFPADAAGIVAKEVLKVLRAQTEADCEVRVSLVPPSTPANVLTFHKP